MSDPSIRKQQIERLQKLTGTEDFDDLVSEFDKLVDMLREHGYRIEKKKEGGKRKERLEAVADVLGVSLEEAWRFSFIESAVATAEDPSETNINDTLHYLYMAKDLT